MIEHGTLPNDELYYEMVANAANNGVVDIPALIAGEAQPSMSNDGGHNLFRVGDAVASRNIHASILDSRRLCQTF